MSDNKQDAAVKAAAEYLKQQHREDALLEATVGRRHAELVGDQASVDAFDDILTYLADYPFVD